MACSIDSAVSGQRSAVSVSLIRSHPVVCRISLLSIVLVALAAGYVVRYVSWVRSLGAYDIAQRDGFANQDFPHLTRHQITQLGMAHRPGFRPASSYTRFDPVKPVGTTRIGIFGCSFVKGSEAPAGQDFPSHLQRLLAAEGRGDVEVLNFGVGAFGLQQSYLLWQFLARRFELDVTVVNLYGFHRQRDDTFVMLGSSYAPVHARYILDGDGLRLLEVAGDDRRAAARGYFGLLPRWRYLRHDAKAPPQLRALLPSGRELGRNPLYYHEDRDREIDALYRRILADMAAGSERLVVLVNDRALDAATEPIGGDQGPAIARIGTERFTWARSSLYRAPDNHPSALGYLVLAHETRAALGGHRLTALPDVEMLGASVTDRTTAADGAALADAGEIVLSLDGRPAAALVEALDPTTVRPFSPSAFGTRSLVDVSGGREAAFIALDRPIAAPAAQVRFEVDGRPTGVEIGDITVNDGGHVGALDRAWTTTSGDGWRLRGGGHRGALALEVASDREISSIRCTIGEETVLEGALDASGRRDWRAIRWISAGGRLLATRGHPEQNATGIIRAGSGRSCVTAVRPGRPDATWCTRRWRLTTTSTPVDADDSAAVLP